jgi:hypothetical protein
MYLQLIIILMFLSVHVMRVQSLVLVIGLLVALPCAAQVDMIPLEANFHAVNVYDFLKEMRVKKMLVDFKDGNINLSRLEANRLLSEVESHWSELSENEKKLVKLFQRTFANPEEELENYTFFFGSSTKNADYFSEMFSDKEKQLYYFHDGKDNLFLEAFSAGDYSNQLSPVTRPNATTYQGGFRFRGTLFDNFGYNVTFIKGAFGGSREVISNVRPELNYNYKFVTPGDVVSSFDFTEGYLRFAAEPKPNTSISVQLGREKIRYGLGYGSRLVISGTHPDLDFIKFNLSYKNLTYSAIHASTAGVFKPTPAERYTKYIAVHHLRLLIPNLFAIGIGDLVVYSDRFDLAYLNPFLFYKFAEHSLQDRDNAAMFFDIQTHFIKNLEFQATFYMDESPDFAKPDLERNKIGYQVGVLWYEFLTVKNLSLALEYSRVRPYVYGHFNERNSLSSFNAPIGHRIGSNADEFFARLAYNITSRLRPTIEFQKVRKGNNVLDAGGNITRNVGGDLLVRQPFETVDTIVPLLSGERVDSYILSSAIRYEPLRNWVLELRYGYRLDDRITVGGSNSQSFITGRFTAEY